MTLAAPLVLIANPNAGHGQGADAVEVAARELRSAGVSDVAIERTGGPGDAVALALRAADGGARTVVAVGGDGTLHEVLNGLLSPGRHGPVPRLGLIPVGGGNDYARELGLPAGDPAGAARLLARGVLRRVDVGRLEGCDHGPELFLNNVGLGFMGTANAARERTRWIPGRASYVAGGLLALLELEAHPLTVWVDGCAMTGRFPIVHVGLGRWCGAGVLLAPGARPDAGRFEVFVQAERSKLGLALRWPRLARGAALGEDAAVLRGRRVRILGPAGLVLHADGEVRRSPVGVVECTLLPGAIEVVQAG